MSETAQVDIFEVLPEILAEVNNNKDQVNDIEQLAYKSHRIPHGIFREVIVNNDKFNSLSEEEQGVLVTTLYTVTKDERINPSNFFNQKQLNKFKKFKKESDEALALPFAFNDYYVIQTTESDYLTALKYKTIAALWNNQILEYNMNLQRKPKEKLNKKTGQIERSPKVITKSVKEITDLMKRKRFRSNTITFCILRNGNEEISYEDGELTVHEGNVFIIDGFHRLSAVLNTVEEDPDNDDAMDVAIKYLSFNEAEEYLGQINKMSKFDKSFVNFLMNDKLEDKIAKEVVNKSALINRVAKEATVSKKSLNITSYNVLAKGIRDIFDPQDGKDRLDIAEVLVNFFDYLLASYPEEFSNNLDKFVAARDKSLRNYHNTFVIYLVIAKALYDKYGKKIPSDEIVRLVELFDYSKDGEYAKVLFKEGTGKVNSNQVKKNVKEYAEEKVKANL